MNQLGDEEYYRAVCEKWEARWEWLFAQVEALRARLADDPYPFHYAPRMEKIDRSARNWNVAELLISTPTSWAVGAPTLKVRYAEGNFSYEEARELVEQWMYLRSKFGDSVTEARIAQWRAATNELDTAQLPYCWSLYQHGATPREGLEAVLQRLVPPLSSATMVVTDHD